MNLEPIRLKPVCKEYLWGGTKLRSDFGKDAPLEKIAESWELAVHKAGMCTVADGSFAGQTLGSYLAANGNKLLGSRAATFEDFPLLIKFIDAADDLSVQVHPDDAYAKVHEGEFGKTEMWYILDYEEGASLYYGLNRELTRDELAARIADNTLLEVLNRVPVQRGDVFFIPPGTIHAIGRGIVLCEIQQNSNTTYRVYDYNRRDKDGNLRELHIEKAVAVADLKPAPARQKAQGNLLASCPYFTAEKVTAAGKAEIAVTKESFRAILTVGGSGALTLGGKTLPIQKGDCVFVPAQDGTVSVSGDCELVIAYV